jgi:hypothetical protein
MDDGPLPPSKGVAMLVLCSSFFLQEKDLYYIYITKIFLRRKILMSFELDLMKYLIRFLS